MPDAPLTTKELAEWLDKLSASMNTREFRNLRLAASRLRELEGVVVSVADEYLTRNTYPSMISYLPGWSCVYCIGTEARDRLLDILTAAGLWERHPTDRTYYRRIEAAQARGRK